MLTKVEQLDSTLPILDGMYRGDDRTIKVTATFPEAIPESNIEAGDPYPLNDKTVWFSAKYRDRDVDEDAVFQKTSLPSGGIVVRGTPDTNICDVDIDPEDTEGVIRAGYLVCDVQASSGVALWTVWKGYLPVNMDVTKASQ